MQYLVKYLTKQNKWNTSTITLPDDVDVEKHVEQTFGKDFIVYKEQVKSKERLRKEQLILDSKVDLLRQG